MTSIALACWFALFGILSLVNTDIPKWVLGLAALIVAVVLLWSGPWRSKVPAIVAALCLLGFGTRAQDVGLPGITNIIGGIDETATNMFSPQELELRLGGVYVQKDNQAAILTAAEYWGLFPKAPGLGFGAELISLGSDTAAAFPYVGYRKCFGNTAGVLFAGGGYDFDADVGMGVFGLRIERRTSKHLGVFASVSYEIAFENQKDHDRGLIAGGGISYVW